MYIRFIRKNKKTHTASQNIFLLLSYWGRFRLNRTAVFIPSWPWCSAVTTRFLTLTCQSTVTSMELYSHMLNHRRRTNTRRSVGREGNKLFNNNGVFDRAFEKSSLLNVFYVLLVTLYWSEWFSIALQISCSFAQWNSSNIKCTTNKIYYYYHHLLSETELQSFLELQIKLKRPPNRENPTQTSVQIRGTTNKDGGVKCELSV